MRRNVAIFQNFQNMLSYDIDNPNSHGSSIRLEGNSYSDFNDKLLSISYLVFYNRKLNRFNVRGFKC